MYKSGKTRWTDATNDDPRLLEFDVCPVRRHALHSIESAGNTKAKLYTNQIFKKPNENRLEDAIYSR